MSMKKNSKMTKRFDLSYHLSEGIRSIWTHAVMSFSAVCMIAACLLIMGTFSLVVLNLDGQLSTLEQDNEFLAYIDDTLSLEEARAIQPKLEALSNVSGVTFVTREEALDIFVANQENELYEDLPSDVLRHRYRIHVHNIQQTEAVAQQVEKIPGIHHVRADLKIANGFIALRNLATIIALVLAAVLLLVSLFIISNTIRLATFYRRDEIAIMKMCGATDWFIRWPFIFEGAILGLTGALAAFGIQWVIYSILARSILAFGAGLLDMAPFTAFLPHILTSFSLAGIAIGGGGSLIAIRKFLQV